MVHRKLKHIFLFLFVVAMTVLAGLQAYALTGITRPKVVAAPKVVAGKAPGAITQFWLYNRLGKVRLIWDDRRQRAEARLRDM